MSSKLTEYLYTEADESISVQADEFDRLIAVEGLRIARFAFFRDLDVWLLILTNRSIISRRLSDYSFLANATNQQLENYVVSGTGIHWPSVDADLSLRGFLIEDAVKMLRSTELPTTTNKR